MTRQDLRQAVRLLGAMFKNHKFRTIILKLRIQGLTLCKCYVRNGSSNDLWLCPRFH